MITPLAQYRIRVEWAEEVDGDRRERWAEYLAELEANWQPLRYLLDVGLPVSADVQSYSIHIIAMLPASEQK